MLSESEWPKSEQKQNFLKSPRALWSYFFCLHLPRMLAGQSLSINISRSPGWSHVLTNDQTMCEERLTFSLSSRILRTGFPSSTFWWLEYQSGSRSSVWRVDRFEWQFSSCQQRLCIVKAIKPTKKPGLSSGTSAARHSLRSHKLSCTCIQNVRSL